MQSPIKLHWFPMEPTWMVSIAVIVIAALPHQIPIPISWGLQAPIGRILGLALTVAVAYYKPVLGMALGILLISTNVSKYIEGFTQTISKDKIEKKHRWTSEEIMFEQPEAIQERSESVLLKDSVTDQDARPWLGERTMGEEPKGIQERSLPLHSTQSFQNTEYGMPTKNSN